MLLQVSELGKTMGAKDLFSDLAFSIDTNEKIALIGRNGEGKTTLLKILAGDDLEYQGSIVARKNLRVTLTKQEHFAESEQSALMYILKSVPHYYEDEKILHDFENGINTDMHLYSETLDRFVHYGYYHIQDKILNTLASFQITPEQAHSSLSLLSGGEKRYVELARMMYSHADLFLVDEPTNHMDYIGKEQFISWLEEETKSVLVVTHDRDVLKHVTKIIEMKNKKLYIFHGNYDHYLQENATRTTNSVKLYQDQLNRLAEAKKKVDWGAAMRAKSKEWKTRYDHWLRDYEALKAETVKPSFWIDQNSTDLLDKKVLNSYTKFKEKNIAIAINAGKQRVNDLLTVRNLSLGYGSPLFNDVSFSLHNDDRVFIKGRNGAGKSTLVQAILSAYKGTIAKNKQFSGEIKLGINLRIGIYEQEINTKYLSMTLNEAIETTYSEHGVPLEDMQLKRLLAQYLFDPVSDGKQIIADLSGGQKARFQIITLLASKPNLLILDEPTNHLDLPSIEELEKALSNFAGGILYISHDTYFIRAIGGEIVEI
jgi:ATPase subunit of ABC transporter with duplicated ATPase domains